METLKAMSCDDAEVAEIIAKVIETGKVTKSQALAISKYIASHKDVKTEKADEQTEEVKNETTVAENATVEDIASSEVVNQDEQTEEGKVGEAETLATSTSEEKMFSNYEELKRAVYGSVWVSNGDAELIEDSDIVDDIAGEIWQATGEGRYGLSEVTDPIELDDAKIWLDLEKNPVDHVYTYNVGCVRCYIVFAGDWDYCYEPRKKASRAHNVSVLACV
jgi:hypothetical protein